MKYEQLTIFDTCPEGGDASDDCADCVYCGDYHLVDGECRCRVSDPIERKFEAPAEVHK